MRRREWLPPTRSWARIVPACLAVSVALAGATGCGRDGAGLIQATSAPAVVDASTSDPFTVTVVPADQRQPAPDLAGPTLGGARLDLADDRGRVVVVNAWASWCPPCREEMPYLRAAYETTDRSDVAFVGLNVNDRAETAGAFAAEVGIPWDSIVDTDGALLSTVPGVPPKSLPSTIVIDRQGRIAATAVGPVDSGELEPVLAEVAAEPAGG